MSIDVEEYNKAFKEKRLNRSETLYEGLAKELSDLKNKNEKFDYVISRIAFLRADFEILTEHMLSRIVKEFEKGS